ncbi:MAG TPA: endonuclease/exonuclease/phosphatase family protein [Pontiella sp.]
MMKKKRSQQTTLTGVLDLMTIGLIAATLMGFAGRLNWILDLFAHFRVQYFQIGLVLIAFALLKGLKKRVVVLILLTTLNYVFVFPLYFGKPTPSSERPNRVLLININASNGNTEKVLRLIRRANPDVLVLEEVTPKWEQELAILRKEYKHQIAEPREDCFGIMLLSKVPLQREQVVEIGSSGIPSILAEAHFPKGAVSIIATHPVPPISATYARNRDNQLKALPKYTKDQKLPVLLIGDLNITPWSPLFRDLIKKSGLRDSVKGFGFQPSWEGNWFMKIPIDHILHSPGITIHNRVLGEHIGSDHRPVIVDFSF